MRVFVAGASGALGRPLVRMLIEAGHDVVGMTGSHPQVIAELGATPAVANAFDAEQVAAAVKQAAPDAVVNLLTRIPRTAYPMPAQFRENNLLRIKGTANLVAAAEAAGVTRMLAESITFAFKGRSEENMKPLTGMGGFQSGIEAAISKEEQTLRAGGIVLRYAYFYGPGTSFNDKILQALRRRMFFILGEGTGWWSFIHVDDAALATIAALDGGRPGETYNICDDDPILAVDALNFMADQLAVKRPRHLPKIGPAFAKVYFNNLTGASNAKAKHELAWEPRYPTFKQGFSAARAL